GEEIAHERQRAVGKIVVEVEHTSRFADHEPATVNHICLLAQYRSNDFGNLGGIILQVRVLDDDDLSRWLSQSMANGCRLPLIHVKTKEFNPRIPLRQALYYLGRAIGRAVVDNDNFLQKVAKRENLFDDDGDSLFFVVNRNQDGYFMARGCHNHALSGNT